MKEYQKREYAKLIKRVRICFESRYKKTNIKAGPQTGSPEYKNYWKPRLR
jgi:hypothetical protein